jgi:hypothetical protein
LDLIYVYESEEPIPAAGPKGCSDFLAKAEKSDKILFNESLIHTGPLFWPLQGNYNGF